MVDSMIYICNFFMELLGVYVVCKHVYGRNVLWYREKVFKNTGKKYPKVIVVLLLLTSCLTGLMEHFTKREELLFIYIFVWMVLVVVISEEKKVRTGMWFFPLFITASIPYYIFGNVLDILNIAYINDSLWSTFFMDLLMIPLIWVLYDLDRKYHFSKRIRNKESKMLFLFCVIITMLSLISGRDGAEAFDIEYSKGISVLSLGVAIFLLFLFVRIVSTGVRSDYYEELSGLHEKHARETFEFYESYKETQHDTRKLRHDMKHHIACMQMLAKQKQYKELEEYLEKFDTAVSEMSLEILTGNDIVDAILNAKNARAKREHIRLLVEGNIAPGVQMDAMDWCNVIGNAVDNGIEALTMVAEEQRVLKITFKQNGSFFLIHIENACIHKIASMEHGIKTTKAEKHMHGFGLENMKNAMEKNRGELLIRCEEREGINVFVVDMLLPIGTWQNNETKS